MLDREGTFQKKKHLNCKKTAGMGRSIGLTRKIQDFPLPRIIENNWFFFWGGTLIMHKCVCNSATFFFSSYSCEINFRLKIDMEKCLLKCTYMNKINYFDTLYLQICSIVCGDSISGDVVQYQSTEHWQAVVSFCRTSLWMTYLVKLLCVTIPLQHSLTGRIID